MAWVRLVTATIFAKERREMGRSRVGKLPIMDKYRRVGQFPVLM